MTPRGRAKWEELQCDPTPRKNVAVKELYQPYNQSQQKLEHSEIREAAALVENNHSFKCLISVFVSLPSFRLILQPLCVIAK